MTPICRADELRIRPSGSRKRSQARLRFIELKAIVHVSRPRAFIRKPDAYIFKLSLHRDIKLVYPPVSRIGIEAGYRWRGDSATSAWKRIGERKYRLSVLNRVEEGFADLIGARSLRSRQRSQRLGENSIAAADNKITAKGSIRYADARCEIAQRRALLGVAGDD